MPESIIAKNDSEFIIRFINHLNLNQNLSIDHHFNSICLNFPDYSEDSRPIFEIQDIKKWLLSTKNEIPYFLMLINFDHELHQRYIVLSSFIEFRKHDEGVIADELSYYSFLKNEIELLENLGTISETDIEIFINHLIDK